MKKTAKFASPRHRESWEQLDWLERDFVKDPGPLIEALRSDKPLPKHLREVLVDLLERHRLKLKQGAKRTPFYRISDSMARLKAAHEEYRTLQLGRHGREAAVKRLAKEYGLVFSTLLNHVVKESSRRRSVRTPPIG